MAAPLQRVVLVAHSHRLGGMERHVVTLGAVLAERGHAVAYAGPADGWLGERMAEAGHPCLDLPMKGMYDPWSAWRLARFARAWGASVLHGHAMRGGRYAGWASRWCGVPAVVSAHSTDAWKWLRPRMQLIAVSEAVREALLGHGLPRERVHLVYNGVPDAASPPGAAPAPPPPARPLRIGLIGRLDPVKGQDIALQALASLRRTGPAQLLLAGAGPAAWTDWLRAQALRLGVAPWVDFLGQVDNVPALLAGLDVVIAPSRREALSLALIEAAAAGRPTVAARVGGIPEVVQDGISGLLVPPDDADSLCRAVGTLAHDAPRREALGRAARMVYESRFTVGAMGEAVESVYRQAQEQ